MESVAKFIRQHVVDRAGAGNPALSGKGRRYELDAVMSLSAGLCAGVAGVSGAVIRDFERKRRKG